MKAITIKFVPPSNTKGARYALSASGWPRKLYERDGNSEAELWDIVKRYIEDLRKAGINPHNNARIVLAGLNEKEDVAALFFEGEDKRLGDLAGNAVRGNPGPSWHQRKRGAKLSHATEWRVVTAGVNGQAVVTFDSESDAREYVKNYTNHHPNDSATVLKPTGKNPAPRSGVRIVQNKMLGGWFVVRGPHQTPLSGRFDTKAEAQAWLKRNNKNPAARKKKVAAKKKAPARKKIAVNAKSRATGKPPSARLKKRRATNTVAGAYPNPMTRRSGSIVVALKGDKVYFLTGKTMLTDVRARAKVYSDDTAARRDARLLAGANSGVQISAANNAATTAQIKAALQQARRYSGKA